MKEEATQKPKEETTQRITVSEQTGKYLFALEKFFEMQEAFARALDNEFPTTGDKLFQKHQTSFYAGRKVIERFLLGSISEKLNTISNTNEM